MDFNAKSLSTITPGGCPAPQVTVRVKVKVKSQLNMVIGADFCIGPNSHVYQQTG